MANNAGLVDRLEYIPFLRDYGSQFLGQRMLSFDSVKLRLEASSRSVSSNSTT